MCAMETLIESPLFHALALALKDSAIILIDRQGKILTWSEGAAHLCGFTAEDVTGEHYGFLFTPVDKASGLPALELEAALSTRFTVFETVRLRKGGQVFRGRVTLAAIFDAHGTHSGFLNVIQDLSGTVRSRERLEEAVDLRDEFLAVASHELRTPLTSLRLATDLYLRKTPDPHHQFASKVARSVDQLTRLVEDMLDVSRIDRERFSIEPSPVGLGQLLSRVVSEAVPLFEAEGKAPPELELEPGTFEGHFDPIRLEQVFTNLLVNSLRHADGKGVRVLLRREGRTAVLDFSDQGPGISGPDAEKVFGRFDRGSKRKGARGMGLGLYISKQIIEAHGGTIRAEAPAKGTLVRITLPLR